MTLSAFIAFMIGVNVEIGLLWQDSQPQGTPAPQQGIVAPGLSQAQWIMAAVVAAGLVLIGMFELIGLGSQRVSLSDGWMGMIFVGYGVFIFFAGIWGNLLPLVNEKSILAVQVLVAVGLLTSAGGFDPWLVIGFVALPAAITLYLVIQRTPIGYIPKALIYLWYLLSLIALSFENGSAAYFSQLDFNLVEGFAFGSVFIFLILHGLYSIRFFLMVSSLILPRNRPYIGSVMPHLFSDEQVRPRQFFWVFCGVLALALLNGLFSLVPQAALLSVSVLVCVQFLFRSPVIPERV